MWHRFSTGEVDAKTWQILTALADTADANTGGAIDGVTPTLHPGFRNSTVPNAC